MFDKKLRATWVGVRITNEQTIIVSTRIKDRPVMLSCNDPDTFRQAVADKAISVQKWAICLPDNLCIKKTLDLPAQSLDEAAQMLEFELPSLVPIAPDEIVYGCTALSQDENTFEIGVYILRKDILDKHLAPYHAIGIYPEKILPESIALYSGFEGHGSDNSVLVCADKTNCHFLTALNGDVRDYGCIANIDIAQDFEPLASEIAKKELELKAHTDDISIIIGSNHDQAITLPRTLKSMGILSPITINPKPACLADNTTATFYDSILAAGALEAVFDNRYKHLNLLPAEHLKLVKTKENRKNALLNAAIIVFVLLLLWANFSIWNWRTKRACQKVRGLIAPIEHIASDVEQKKLLVRALQAQTSDRQKISDIFYELYKYTPESITISELRYHQKADKRFLSLKGYTDSLPKAFDYSEAMKESMLLNQMQINNVQQIPTPGGSIVEFKAECLLEEK